MVLSYTHPYTNTVRQDRNQAVCALQTEPIVCRWAFNGPTAGHKEHTAPAHCYASHWPTLSHPEGRRQLTGTPTSAVYMHFCWVLKSTFCVYFLLRPVRFFKARREILTQSFEEENRFVKTCGTVKEWAETPRWGESGAGCLSEVLCTLTHTCIHTHKHTSQPLPLTPSCTAA